MDKSPDDVAADESEQPQNQKNDSNGPKHFPSPFCLVFALSPVINFLLF
jgi:hypothetical protein